MEKQLRIELLEVRSDGTATFNWEKIRSKAAEYLEDHSTEEIAFWCAALLAARSPEDDKDKDKR